MMLMHNRWLSVSNYMPNSSSHAIDVFGNILYANAVLHISNLYGSLVTLKALPVANIQIGHEVLNDYGDLFAS